MNNWKYDWISQSRSQQPDSVGQAGVQKRSQTGSAERTRSRSGRPEVEKVAMVEGRVQVPSPCFTGSPVPSVVAKMTAKETVGLDSLYTLFVIGFV